MRILAIETTDVAGSIATLEMGRILAAHDLDPRLRSAQTLAPAIVSLLEKVTWRPGDVQLVAVATGPGSFTGLRVGVATAKLFAYAVGAEVLGVNTLEVIAAQNTAEAEGAELWAVLDAQRNQVFAGRFKRDNAGWQWQGETTLLENSAWIAGLLPGQIISGPVLEKLADKLPGGITVVDRALWAPKGATVGQLAWKHYQAGRRDGVFGLLPQYFRPSAAEEKRAAH
jgi:tRNA threonylcarbamoyladenosine biosynthesis protein TsaB